MQRHSAALSGTQRHSAALGGTQRHAAALSGTRWHSVRWHSACNEGGTQHAMRAALSGVALSMHSAYHQEDCHRSPQTLHSSVSSASSHARPKPLHLHIGFTHAGLALPLAGLRTLDACNSLRSSASSPKSSTSVTAAFASRLVCRRGGSHVQSRPVTSSHVQSRQVL